LHGGEGPHLERDGAVHLDVQVPLVDAEHADPPGDLRVAGEVVLLAEDEVRGVDAGRDAVGEHVQRHVHAHGAVGAHLAPGRVRHAHRLPAVVEVRLAAAEREGRHVGVLDGDVGAERRVHGHRVLRRRAGAAVHALQRHAVHGQHGVLHPEHGQRQHQHGDAQEDHGGGAAAAAPEQAPPLAEVLRRPPAPGGGRGLLLVPRRRRVDGRGRDGDRPRRLLLPGRRRGVVRYCGRRRRRHGVEAGTGMGARRRTMMRAGLGCENLDAGSRGLICVGFSHKARAFVFSLWRAAVHRVRVLRDGAGQTRRLDFAVASALDLWSGPINGPAEILFFFR
jgi:hypothetical protein